ncbi:OmpH family outer membrane protein [Flavobacterium aciduliphilum]|uniref:Periplasmic chaperone for outer membrane proteins Skp n=1 Tax=Flavobacterium aciduliphilum TaxID=1101402 RepID=A0A328YH57_9FLAO|nr:OmpH family outer membrane protein [Flavobacterium aciduliphilum]RAR72870.1 periplasmic chaperone for outer membrane proteins Skp [Flavobacterium aciduliphilum]
MKKILVCIAFGFAIISCNKATDAKDFKTAYIDTNKLLEESTEAKDIKAKYENIAGEKDNRIKVEVDKLEAEKKSFQSNAQKKGQAWAQQKYAELQQREQQIQYAQQAVIQQLQGQHGAEMDTLVTKYRKIFKDYGKEKGYDYVFGTGESATVLYAKDQYDITKEIIKIVNDKYKSESKKEEKKEDKSKK